MSGWCRRCGQYYYQDGGCSCAMVGRVWRPEAGETEDDSREVWGWVGSEDCAIQRWAARVDSDDCCEVFEHEQTVAFRPPNKEVSYHTIRRESEPVYYVSEASESDREAARKMQAKTLRHQRKWDREQRERAVAKSTT